MRLHIVSNEATIFIRQLNGHVFVFISRIESRKGVEPEVCRY
jgi:hypothetical protein